MNDAEDQQVEQIKSEIEEFEDSSIGNIPFELLEKQGNRTTKLIETSGEAGPIEGRRRWHDFRFKEPVLVTKVSVNVGGYGEYSEFEFVWETESGKERRSGATPSNGLVVFTVNDICKAVSFRPPSVFFAKSQIHSVRIEGIKRDDVPAALDSLSDLESLKQSIIQIADTAIARADRKIAEATQADVQKANLLRESGNLKQNIARLKKNVEDLSLKKNELTTENGEASRTLEVSQARTRDLEARTKLLEASKANLDKEIESKKSELKGLKNNINLFPTEIVEFVDQGSKNIKQYFWLAAAPIIIIVVMFVLLIQGAADLTTVITSTSNVNLQALVLSRLPYVTIALALITACYKIARAFFNEMIRINSQRLNLTKVSIIAKDVSSAAEYGLDLPDEDLYRLRTELKMTLLKDHLKDYISKDFNVELPKRIVDALGLADDSITVRTSTKESESA